MSERVKENVAELSSKILAGWTMLNESCPRPGCNVPLVRGPDKRPYCCNCKVYTEEDGSAPPEYVQSPARQKADLERSFQEARERESTQQQQQQQQSYHRDDTTGHASSSSSSRLSTSNTAASTVSAAMTSASSPARKPKSSRTDQVSGLIANKLLQGWALLDDLCPVEDCRAPLMRNREKQLWCVACDARVLSRQEQDALGASSARQHSALSSSPSRQQDDKQQQQQQQQQQHGEEEEKRKRRAEQELRRDQADERARQEQEAIQERQRQDLEERRRQLLEQAQEAYQGSSVSPQTTTNGTTTTRSSAAVPVSSSSRLSDRITQDHTSISRLGLASHSRIDAHSARRAAAEALTHTLHLSSLELMSASTFEQRRRLLTMVTDCLAGLEQVKDVADCK